MRLLTRCSATLLCAAICSALSAGVLLEPTSAPDWKVSEWINGNGGQIEDHRGKVILIQFFQLWCPGCNEFSIPLFRRWNEEFGSRDDVVVLSIHTVFEGHELQTPQLLRAFVAEKGIVHPVGIDAYENEGDAVPITMDRFETGGTPHIVIIDHQGKLRFSHFGRFDPEPVERFITRLLDDKNKTRMGTTTRGSGRASREQQTRRPSPPPRARAKSPPVETDQPGEEEEGEEEQDDLQKDLSGSFKLRFEPLSRSCGDIGQPVEVITQVSVYENRIVAKFSRAYLNIRSLTASYDPGSGQIEATIEQPGREKGGVSVDLSLQLSGRVLLVDEQPELDFDYYLDKRSEDGKFDCVIEGRGSGTRFRSR